MTTYAGSIVAGATTIPLYDGQVDPISIDPGETSWQRITADSPFIAGRRLVGAVPGTPVLVMVLRLKAATAASLDTLVDDVVDAISQSFTVTITVDGVDHVWTCEPADYSRPLEPALARVTMAKVTLSAPRLP